MTTKQKTLTVTLIAAVIAFLFAPTSPLGQAIWPPPLLELDPAPTAAQIGLLMLLGVMEALTFGAGLAFLLYGRPYVRDLVGSDRPGLARAMHLSIFWLLWNWWLHIALHMVTGTSPAGLLMVDYAFHVPLFASAGILAYGAVVVARDRVSVAQTSPVGR